VNVSDQQLTLADEIEDDMSFGEWVESLPLDPGESTARSGALALRSPPQLEETQRSLGEAA
jgi:hypothetical protein